MQHQLTNLCLVSISDPPFKQKLKQMDFEVTISVMSAVKNSCFKSPLHILYMYACFMPGYEFK